MQTNADSGERFLAAKEVAAKLRLSTSAIYRAVERGDLPAFRLGERGSLRIPASTLERFRRFERATEKAAEPFKRLQERAR